MPTLSNDAYRVGWICAQREEMVAARAMLDKDHGLIKGSGQDNNIYYAGRIHDHHVIIAGLPAGINGNVSAASVARDMARTFKWLRFVLLVGTGGGIPCVEEGVDIRLGDIVVSQPSGDNGGVIQYDRGKYIHGGGLVRKGALGPPPNKLLTALTALQVEHDLNDSLQMWDYLEEAGGNKPSLESRGYCNVAPAADRLFKPTYEHPDGRRDCTMCSPAEEIARDARLLPKIHYGVIASGERVVEDPMFRDSLRKSFGAICVDTEAAGVAHNFPWLVIKGICHYADSHKNDDWRNYAAMTAATYAKELLTYVSSDEDVFEKPIAEVSAKWCIRRLDTAPPLPSTGSHHTARPEKQAQSQSTN